MPSSHPPMDLEDCLRICKIYFEGRGFKVRRKAKLHRKLDRKFHMICSDATKRYAIDILSSISQFDDIVLCKKMISDQSTFSHLEIGIATAKQRIVLDLQQSCTDSGLGLYLIKDDRLSEIVQPSKKIVQAKQSKLEIEELIRDINLRSYNICSVKLFPIERMGFDTLDLACTDEKDLTTLILALNTMIDNIDRDAITKKGSTLQKKNATSIDYLEQFLVDQGFSCDPTAFTLLRSVKVLRNNRPPIHDSSHYKEICKSITGRKNPDVETLASCCISRFLRSLYYIRISLV